MTKFLPIVFFGIAAAASSLLAGTVAVPTFTPLLTDRAAARLLDQATWGVTPSSIASLQAMGAENWLASQFALKTSDLPDQPLLTSSGTTNRDIRPVRIAFLQNAVTQPDQLRQRVAFALSEIWVVSSVDVKYPYAFPPYWRIFRDHAFGNYRDIVKAATLSPAMGHYLNMANNNKGNPSKGTAANENYARELMQLFTIGLVQLNPDGSVALDGNQNAIPNYTQAEVTDLARVLTGWTYPTAPGATPKHNNPTYFTGQMFAVESNHDRSAKEIFGGVTVPAGQTAEQDLETLLDALMAQPSMAPFVSQQLIQHLVTSNPSAAYVARVAQTFRDDGKGVRGDMKAVIRAVLLDEEARAGDIENAVTDPSFGHMREPVLFAANLVRGLNGAIATGSKVDEYPTAMGESLFTAPTVFSYFSPQYRIAGNLFGPEFQIYSTQTAVERANMVYSALYRTLDKQTAVDLTPFEQVFANRGSSGLIDYISQVFLYHSMSSGLQDAALAATNAATKPSDAVKAALYVTLTSGEYQIVH